MLDCRMNFPGINRMKQSLCKKMEWEVPPPPGQLDLEPQSFLPGPEINGQELGSWGS